jgi:uncharacterized protein (DUF58 family)
MKPDSGVGQLKLTARASGRPSRMIFRAPGLVAAVAVFTGFYAVSRYRGWLFLLLGTAGLWLLAYLWARGLRGGLHVRRRVRAPSATVGQHVEEHLRLVNDGRWPAVWVEIEDRSIGLSDPVRLVSEVAGRSSRTRWPLHRVNRRGIYSLGPTRLRCGDPFGVYTVEVDDPASESLIVLPPIVDLSPIRALAAGGLGGAGMDRHSLVRRAGDAGVREYLPGDDLRTIHWPATAHRGDLAVRRPEPSADEDWWIVLDLEAGVQAGTGSKSTLELGIVLAASLAARGLSRGRRVGLCFAGPEVVVLPQSRAVRQRWRIQRALAGADAGRWTLDRLLQLRSARANQRGAQIIVTASNEPEWVARARRSERGVSFVCLLDGSEFGGRPPRRSAAALAHAGIPMRLFGPHTLLQAYPDLEGGASPRPVSHMVSRLSAIAGRDPWLPGS